ncbi:S-adenosyl-L-methionine-dependent methyltransferase [Clathrospora elynae]|uniref:S-adenosyl-L-methionine-dependent methyltransferase n=1 Tax=Clathrospora elynae TaxID=706981 RepID=A0A6A5SVV8_9PLEO|nr:S-adenosyl-L-methionine-dependent methyltransferase [Clathrospora elynae]
MTQPTSVDMTFDTSLVDLKPNANTSFSTTESDPTSDFGTLDHPSNIAPNTQTQTLKQTSMFEAQAQQPPKQNENLSTVMPPPKSSTPVQHISTQETYDEWAAVYDSDGNMLQAIDDLELETYLPDFLSQVQNSTAGRDISVLDLGCGTGRNTAKLLSYAWSRDRRVSVTGLDFSRGMLNVAAAKLSPLAKEKRGNVDLRLECCNCFPTVFSSSSSSPFPMVKDLQPVNAVLSTLVLEHIPLLPFFTTLLALLAPGGLALVTNMHADMGRVSQAGFVNAQGVKVRGSSFVYTVQETVDAAKGAGFEVLGRREREVQRRDMEGKGAVGERGWKWVGVRVWYAIVVKKKV